MRAERRVVTVVILELNEDDQKELDLILKLADKEATRLAIMDEVEMVHKWQKTTQHAASLNGRV